MQRPGQAAPQRSRRTAKQRADRQRRDRRELVRELLERAERLMAAVLPMG